MRLRKQFDGSQDRARSRQIVREQINAFDPSTDPFSCSKDADKLASVRRSCRCGNFLKGSLTSVATGRRGMKACDMKVCGMKVCGITERDANASVHVRYLARRGRAAGGPREGRGRARQAGSRF